MMPCLCRKADFPQQDEQFPLTDGYSVRSKAYCHDGDLYLNGSENELLDKEGRVRYAWRNLDTDGEFCSLFRHRNGKHYLIFRTELYGYSVLEVESGQEMHCHGATSKLNYECVSWTRIGGNLWSTDDMDFPNGNQAPARSSSTPVSGSRSH